MGACDAGLTGPKKSGRNQHLLTFADTRKSHLVVDSVICEGAS